MTSNKAAVIFLAILAVGGLGLSGYLFVKDTFFGGEENLKLVALWNHLEKNTDTPPFNLDTNFLMEYSETELVNPKYVNVINETHFALPYTGLYKINLNVITEGLSASSTYWVSLLYNNWILEYFDFFETPASDFSLYHYTSNSVYINSTGGDIFYQFKMNSMDAFGIYTGSSYNQLSIEYVL